MKTGGTTKAKILILSEPAGGFHNVSGDVALSTAGAEEEMCGLENMGWRGTEVNKRRYRKPGQRENRQVGTMRHDERQS